LLEKAKERLVGLVCTLALIKRTNSGRVWRPGLNGEDTGIRADTPENRER